MAEGLVVDPAVMSQWLEHAATLDKRDRDWQYDSEKIFIE